MSKYREVGTVVDAVQWFPSDNERPDIIVNRYSGFDPVTHQPIDMVTYDFKPGYSKRRISPGDWIIDANDYDNVAVMSDEYFRECYRPLAEDEEA